MPSWMEFVDWHGKIKKKKKKTESREKHDYY